MTNHPLRTPFPFKTISDDKYLDIATYVLIFTKVTQLDKRKKLWRKHCTETKRGSNNYWSKLVFKIRTMDGTLDTRKELLRHFEVCGTKKPKSDDDDETWSLEENPRVYYTVNRMKRRLVKESDREGVIKKIFENPRLGSYRGRDTIYEYMKTHFIGISRQFVSEVLQKYEVNQRGSAMQIRGDIPNEQIIVSRPNDYWQADITQFKVIYPGNDAVTKKLLVVVDICTRFAWAITIEVLGKKKVNREYSEKITKLRQLFLREGHPRTLHGDNEFSGLKTLCNTFDVKLVLGTPYKHTDQACVERLHQTLKVAVARYMWDNPKGGNEPHWERYIDDVVYAYNNKTHSDLKGQCPFDLYKPSSSKENVNRIIHSFESFRALESKLDDDHIQHEDGESMDDNCSARMCTINIRQPSKSECTEVVVQDVTDTKEADSALQFNADVLDGFSESEHIFPVGTEVCYHHNKVTLCQATILKVIRAEKPKKPKYSIKLRAEGLNFDGEEKEVNVDTVHSNIRSALDNTFFNDVHRPYNDKDNNETLSKNCKFYSATTVGSPYKDNERADVQHNVGIPFDQNVVAQTLFYIMYHNNKKPWKKKGEIRGFDRERMDSYVQECYGRRKDNIFGVYLSRRTTVPFYTSEKDTDDFWYYLSRRTNVPFYTSEKDRNGKKRQMALIPLFLEFVKDLDPNKIGDNWTFTGQRTRPITYDENYMSYGRIGKSTDNVRDVKCFRHRTSKRPKKYDERYDVAKRAIFYNVVWSTNEILRHPNLNTKPTLLKAVKQFLDFVIPKYNPQEPSLNIPHEPFIDEKYLYACPISKYARRLFEFNDEKVLVKSDDPKHPDPYEFRRNFLCWDTLLMFVYNVHEWMNILREKKIYVAGYEEPYFYEIDRIKTQYNEQRGEGGKDNNLREGPNNLTGTETSDEQSWRPTEEERHRRMEPDGFETKQQDGQKGSGYNSLKHRRGKHRGGEPPVSIKRNYEVQKQKKLANAELYQKRITKRCREIEAIEKRVKGTKYEVVVGDIVRVKNTHIQEPHTEDKNGKSMGNLHIEKNDSAIRSADPNRLDRYNLRLKWSESLYYVLAVGRVYQFKEDNNKEDNKEDNNKEDNDKETRHAFISCKLKQSESGTTSPGTTSPSHRGDFREKVNIDILDGHSTYIKALLKGEYSKGNKKIKFVLNPDVNKLARLRYILVRITTEFLKDIYPKKGLMPKTIDLKKLQDQIQQFRKNVNNPADVQKYLPMVTHRKPKKDGIRRAKEHHQNTKQVKYFYRNNLLKQLHNVILRKPKPKKNTRNQMAVDSNPDDSNS